LPAEQVYEDLRDRHLKGLNVGLVHGRMKAKDKDEILESFRAGRLDVLVSTTVIEVGVNVPNATIMVIENAERFGLAQLHQLRGRVGRGDQASWCFLMSEPNERLRFMTHTNDGFLVAQKDMELRGPGELFGTRQSGAIAEGAMLMNADAELLKQTHDLAHALLNDPDGDDAKQVIRLAEERYREKLDEIAMN
ncbi:MAG: DNA helicase RecG, partial [Clostridiales bacterium]|nr:DNA helicase RecG [Clostridiales bacterium]